MTPIKALFFLSITLILVIFFYSYNSYRYIARGQIEAVYITPAPTLDTYKYQPLTLEKIFSKEKAWLVKIPEEEKIVLLATGDIIPARSVNAKMFELGNFNWAFEKTADILKTSNITLVNFETPLVENCPVTYIGMVFCGDQRNIQGLLAAGVDVASVANNHFGDWGIKGIEETKKLLNDSGILVTGINGPLFLNIKGKKFAFLSYNDITPKINSLSVAEEEKIGREIIEAKLKTDYVIVSFHWGIEYTSQPDDRQKDLAYLAIDKGADLIIGNHPHWIQPVEVYKEKIITYAHGNFIFDQMWSKKTMEGVIGKYTFYRERIVDVEFLPVAIAPYGQAYIVAGEEKDRILSEMQNESINLSLE